MGMAQGTEEDVSESVTIVILLLSKRVVLTWDVNLLQVLNVLGAACFKTQARISSSV